MACNRWLLAKRREMRRGLAALVSARRRQEVETSWVEAIQKASFECEPIRSSQCLLSREP